jgi:hypothetical protein
MNNAAIFGNLLRKVPMLIEAASCAERYMTENSWIGNISATDLRPVGAALIAFPHQI